MEKIRRLAEELSEKGEISINMKKLATTTEKKIYSFVCDLAENGANKKSSKEYIDTFGLEGMELFIRYSQWPEEMVKLKCKKVKEKMEAEYRGLMMELKINENTRVVRNSKGEIIKLIKPLKILEKLRKINIQDFLNLNAVECESEQQLLTLCVYLNENGIKTYRGNDFREIPWVRKYQYLLLKERAWETYYIGNDFVEFKDIFKKIEENKLGGENGSNG